MYSVDGSYDNPQRHSSSVPLSVDGRQPYATTTAYGDHGNQYLDGYQHRDDRFGYVSGQNLGSDFPPNSQFHDDYDHQFSYRTSDYPDGSRNPDDQGPSGNRYLSSPYGSEMEGNYGYGPQDDAPKPYGAKHPLQTNPSYPVTTGDGQYQPSYYGVERQRKTGAMDEAFSDQVSSTQEEVNPLDERFSEQDTIPMDERFSDRHYGAGGRGMSNVDQNDLIGPNEWNPSYPRRDDNFGDGSVRDSMLHLSIQDNRPAISPSPYSQMQTITATQIQPLNVSAHHSPSLNSQVIDSKWRNPDLREVIDYLNHQNDAVKANAAAYLQHLCYMDDNIKAQTRVLRGIPALVDLVSNPLPEVHRSACGALRNLSYGRANDENKIEIKNVGGITVLVRLLRKTGDNEIREIITGILWNLSSCSELKKPIIDEGVKSIVDAIVIPTAGLDHTRGPNEGMQNEAYRSTVFRNASGVLRNVSSDGEYARKKLRECDGLVESMIRIVKLAITCNDIDNKSVENSVCLLRNLSYACQEIVDPDYLKKRSTAVSKNKDDSTGCFGGKSKKKSSGKNTKSTQKNQLNNQPPYSPQTRGMDQLWHTEIVRIYLQLLQDCSNPETLEAAAGAIQNLAACDWQPSVEIRTAVRIEKGISVIVALIKEPSDKVVCAAATTLRNLALDEKNKQLIGKYIMHDMVSKLPSQERPAELALSNETIAAMEATLYEVIKSSSEFAKLLMQEGGVERLMHIVRSPLGIYNDKVIRYAYQLLQKMWSFTEFHEEYKKKGWKQSDFMSSSTLARSDLPSAENTINRARMGQSGPSMPGYNDRTMIINRHPHQQQRQYMNDDTIPDVMFSSGPNVDGRHHITDPYSSQNQIREDIPLTRMEYPVDSSREILYFNSTDHIPQSINEHQRFPPNYDLSEYPSEPPKYDSHDYSMAAQGYGSPNNHMNQYSDSVDGSYGSQARHTHPDPTPGGTYIQRRTDPSNNSFDAQNQDMNYRPGFGEYSMVPNRDHEPLYSRITKPDRYGDLHIEGADNAAQDVDSWV